MSNMSFSEEGLAREFDGGFRAGLITQRESNIRSAPDERGPCLFKALSKVRMTELDIDSQGRDVAQVIWSFYLAERVCGQGVRSGLNVAVAPSYEGSCTNIYKVEKPCQQEPRTPDVEPTAEQDSDGTVDDPNCEDCGDVEDKMVRIFSTFLCLHSS
jgi:hypothetical protein